ncbi:hypothetical protein Scep_000778 [Stephania cephalantha]|uniref:Uncharacterized protein n=1 Tax=Stephania cephalantha TaxID=152367 RepID=A0AAP0L893_9MAGN
MVAPSSHNYTQDYKRLLFKYKPPKRQKEALWDFCRSLSCSSIPSLTPLSSIHPSVTLHSKFKTSNPSSTLQSSPQPHACASTHHHHRQFIVTMGPSSCTQR